MCTTLDLLRGKAHILLLFPCRHKIKDVLRRALSSAGCLFMSPIRRTPPDNLRRSLQSFKLPCILWTLHSNSLAFATSRDLVFLCSGRKQVVPAHDPPKTGDVFPQDTQHMMACRKLYLVLGWQTTGIGISPPKLGV